MKTLKRKWRSQRKYEKGAVISICVLSVAIVLFMALRLFDIKPITLPVYLVMMTLLLASFAVQLWRKNRKPALACIYTSAFTLLAFVLELLR